VKESVAFAAARNRCRISFGTHVATHSHQAPTVYRSGSDYGEFIMSNASKRAEGAAEELGGKIKGTIGKLIGNEQMEAEGKAKELKGKAKQEAAKSAERGKGAVQEAVGAAKSRIGAVIDNEQMEAEGRAKELEGEARQHANR
jgi:uncharacterized protein YjbJ (UPF0337 family)